MLDWFTTIPGILVICGVILLVIAIILFIAGNKKAKKEEMVQTNPVTESANTMNTEVNTTADTNIGEVNAEKASKLAEEPELVSEQYFTPSHLAKRLSNLCAQGPAVNQKSKEESTKLINSLSS